MIKHYGLMGSAVAELVAYTLYNVLRTEFLRRRFQMQPFDQKNLLSLLVALLSFGAAYLLFKGMHGWLPIFGRAIVFSGLFAAAVFWFRLTPDAHQLLEVVKKKWTPNS
jgi:hypothetical protein